MRLVQGVDQIGNKLKQTLKTKEELEDKNKQVCGSFASHSK